MSPPRLAVHAHFYQPPRDDPATGEIPAEASAAPFPHWNARIAAECYRPNAELGNYRRLSFDFGPTLLSWLEEAEPATYEEVVAASRSPRAAALAQPYHHTILPLAGAADREIQIAWGLADFEHRFGRPARGMWLPETAADLPTLQALADAGMKYTLLAPWQAADEEGLDPLRPYWVELGGERRIAVFFFHRELSGALSFDPAATRRAEDFVQRWLVPAVDSPAASETSRSPATDAEPGLLLLASDGELYGHHQKFRDLFLERLLGAEAAAAGFQTTTPEAYLRRNPPKKAIRLVEEGSWSCHHGVERWRATCPCTPESAWKAPLRRAMDRMAADLDAPWTAALRPWGADPHRLLLRYSRVFLGQIPLKEWLGQELGSTPSAADRKRLALLLEAQRLRQRMFTSCAWFHSDLDRLEPRGVLASASRAAELTRQATGIDLRARAREHLAGVVERDFEAASLFQAAAAGLCS